MLPTSIPDASGNEKSGLDMYFLEQDGGTFKATVRTIRDRHATTWYRKMRRDGTPPLPMFKARLLHNQADANTEMVVVETSRR